MCDVAAHARMGRRGYLISCPSDDVLRAVREELVVTPVSSFDGGQPAMSFALYTYDAQQKELCVPRAWGSKRYGDRVRYVASPCAPAPFDVCLDPDFELNEARYQVSAVRAVEAALLVGEDADATSTCAGCVLSLAVGLGKTACAIYLMAKSIRLRTLVIVHTNALMNQWEERIQQFVPGARVGRIQGPRFDCDGFDVVIGMLQTLSSREDFDDDAFDSFGLVVVDECHTVCTRMFSRALRLVGGVQYVLGLSATPTRRDGLSSVVAAHIGPVVFRADRESVVGMRVTMLRVCRANVTESVLWNGKCNHSKMLGELAMDTRRNLSIARAIAAVRHMKVLVLSDRRCQLEALSHLLVSECGVHTEDVGMYVGGRDEADLQHVANTCTIILGTYQIASVGLDIGGLNALVFATPRSDVRQAIGRILRDGAESCTPKSIIDVCDDAFPVFAAQQRKRASIYRKMRFTIERVLESGAVEATKSVAQHCLIEDDDD